VAGAPKKRGVGVGGGQPHPIARPWDPHRVPGLPPGGPEGGLGCPQGAPVALPRGWPLSEVGGPPGCPQGFPRPPPLEGAGGAGP
jgi:hypothetical protein